MTNEIETPYCRTMKCFLLIVVVLLVGLPMSLQQFMYGPMMGPGFGYPGMGYGGMGMYNPGGMIGAMKGANIGAALGGLIGSLSG